MKIDKIEQLAEYVKTTTIPLMKDLLKSEGGPMIAEVVEELVSKRYETLVKEAPWMEAMKDVSNDKSKHGKKERTVGEAAGRFIRAVMALKIAGREQTEENVVKQLKNWGDGDLVDIIAKDRSEREAWAKAQGVSIPQDGGFLVPQDFANEVIELLRPQSVVRSMVGRTIQMPVGNMNIPKVTEGSTAYYLGENTNATKSQLKFGNMKLSFKKLVTLVPLSNDLVRYSSAGADSIVRGDMVRAMAQRENQAFLRDPGTESTPRGLKYQMAASNLIDVSNPTFTVQTVATDLGRIVLQLVNNNVPLSKPGWLFAPRTWNYLRMLQTTTGAFIYQAEMNNGMLLGYPFKWTPVIQTNLGDHGRTSTGSGGGETEIYFADWDDVVIGEAMALRIDASQEASYIEGANLVSAFSQDQLVVRAITEHDFGVRRDVSVCVMNGITWA